MVQDRGVDFRRFSGSCPFNLLLSHPKGMTATDDGAEEDVINDGSEDGLEEDDDVRFKEVEEEGFEAAERSFDEFFDDPPAAQRPTAGSLLLLHFCSWKMEQIINLSSTKKVHNDLNHEIKNLLTDFSSFPPGFFRSSFEAEESFDEELLDPLPLPQSMDKDSAAAAGFFFL